MNDTDKINAKMNDIELKCFTTAHNDGNTKALVAALRIALEYIEGKVEAGHQGRTTLSAIAEALEGK
jgi:hypothetical protein